MTRLQTTALLATLLCLVAACSQPSPATDASGRGGESETAAMSEAATDTPARIPATREDVAMAYKCQGLLSAAAAAKTMLGDDVPEDLQAVTFGTANYWIERASQLEAPGLTEADTDKMLAESVRVFSSPQTLRNALPEIRVCLELQNRP